MENRSGLLRDGRRERFDFSEQAERFILLMPILYTYIYIFICLFIYFFRLFIYLFIFYVYTYTYIRCLKFAISSWRLAQSPVPLEPSWV